MMKPTKPPSARTRIYWLSWLVHNLQGKIYDDTVNENARKAVGSSRIGKTLIHLSTCLTRGGKTEASRIVAVTSSIHDIHGVSVQVFGSPPSSPESTPHVPPSSSSTSGAAVGEEIESIKNVVLARNSHDAKPAGKVRTANIEPEMAAAFTLIDAIMKRTKPPADLVPRLEDFSDYVFCSLAILRVGADLLRANSELNRQAVRRAVCVYFLQSCYRKLKSRVAAFKILFPMATLTDWTMSSQEDTFTAVDIDVADVLVQKVLEEAGLVPINSRYTADVTTIALWWKALMALIMILQEQHSGHAANNPPTTRRSPGNQDAEEEELEVDEEMSSLNNPISAGLPMPTALPYCSTFYRAVDALTAWTTGPTYLLHSRVATTTPNITLTVVDLPRATIPSTSVEELLCCWEAEKWTPEQLGKIQAQLKDGNPSTPPLDGECHAEAGLIASAIAHIGQRVQQVSRGVDPAEEQAPGGGTGSYSGEESINTLEPDDLANMFQAGDGSGGSIGEDPLNEPEPESEDLANVFRSMFPQASSQLELAIGVARKCCPLCRILADVAEQQYNIKLDLPGQHARFHPWSGFLAGK
ncbi:hypothetical protein C8J57DRAFT_1574269 [Mycena rebaudengoi]|nr:hypothetical protein C8J57DRAFT_1574269 [Mycena rebaudengoi]